MAQLDELVQWLDTELNVKNIKDGSANGLIILAPLCTGRYPVKRGDQGVERINESLESHFAELLRRIFFISFNLELS